MYAKDIAYSQYLDDNYKFDSRSNINDLMKSLKLTRQQTSYHEEKREELHKSSYFVRDSQALFSNYYQYENSRDAIPVAYQAREIPQKAREDAKEEGGLTQSQYFSHLLSELPKQYVENIDIEQPKQVPQSAQQAVSPPNRPVGVDKEPTTVYHVHASETRYQEQDFTLAQLPNSEGPANASQSSKGRSPSKKPANSQNSVAKVFDQLKTQYELRIRQQKYYYEAEIAELREELRKCQESSLMTENNEGESLIQQLLEQNRRNQEHIKDLQSIIQKQQVQNSHLTYQLKQSQTEARDNCMFIQSIINEDTSKIAGQVQVFDENLGASAGEMALTRWREE